MEWQPIETAPKDGTRVLAYDGEIITVARWHETEEFEGGFGWTDLTVADWKYEEYWQMFPTHWMPLPEPPRK